MLLISCIFLALAQHWLLVAGQAQAALSPPSHSRPPPHHSLLGDRAALLEFKKTIRSDPNSTLGNWNATVDVCSFTGVICDAQGHRVAYLILEGQGLAGRLSPFLSNLTGLRNLSLASNHFFGTIPPELSSLRRLCVLLLQGNNLGGPVPHSFAFLTNLRTLFLWDNKLTGTLPVSLFANCTKLDNIDLSTNSLYGEIPLEIGNCRNLYSLSLYNNQFTGHLPISLRNASQMFNIDVESNNLEGPLPSDIVERLPLLKYLHLSYNKMQSHEDNTNLDIFFTSLANCTHLLDIELESMDLGGSLTNSVGQLSVTLKNLLLEENQIFGPIPPAVGRFSDLLLLNLSSNLLNGSIPEEIKGLLSLDRLYFSRNSFRGKIPTVLSQLPRLGLLDLSYNEFFGEIPASLANMVEMRSLFLNNNLLSGNIPPSLGRLSQLFQLDLSHNQLSGRIPPELLLGINEIRMYLGLSHNNLEGPLPIELSKLEKLQVMDLSSNNFSGSIFFQILSCIELKAINFSNNSLVGRLPDSLGDLKNLESFDVSWNRLSGPITASLNKIETLRFLNLSYNNFQGMIPSGGIFKSVTSLSFLGNERLCGTIPGIPACSGKKTWFRSSTFLIIFIVVIFASSCLSTICCVIGCRRFKIITSSGKTEPISMPKTPGPVCNFPRITYKELADATGGFDDQSLVGSGSYGRVYKGVLPDGTVIAVKVLHVQSGNSTKSFSRECQVLKRIRHRNLIRIITACSLPEFKAIVLPYMANGNLDSHLYLPSGTGLSSRSSDLTLIQRVNICSDVAEGMAYLHHHSPVRVVHCDLKPSNVLLNDDMTALVSDFGIARLIMSSGGGNAALVENMGNSTANLLCGSIGYIAPEYGFGSNTSTTGDVYSFGILVLEMVTRRRPTDDMFAGGLNLHKWVKSHYHGRAEMIIDSSLLRASRDQSPEMQKMWEVAIAELIELGIFCTQDSPSRRPTMLDAAEDLDRLKRYLSGDTTATSASSLGISSSTFGTDD
ncbi:putative leucine-rich repeat receptor-like serine/threonine-protein kinase At2g24130 [Syzygium oleosum]|uniref:putative leucine-rich repeat receptor-like serine/threonine-protein kinase At2g24130 n=1 Tax=Syzygium oleosum TaxID=219896 RepID=UPI0024B9517B|nr:putative leucine-rich repeat receptor-like serine/threonine-protein kinase At2g24130 [Syzygium oleosum]